MRGPREEGGVGGGGEEGLREGDAERIRRRRRRRGRGRGEKRASEHN